MPGRIAAAEAGFYGGGEVPIAAVLAWLIPSEIPPSKTLLAGAIAIFAILWRSIADLQAAAERDAVG